MGDKVGVSSRLRGISKSITSPESKRRKKPAIAPAEIGIRPPPTSHTPEHRKAQRAERRLQAKKPRTAKQKAATAANFKKMMQKAARKATKR